MSIKPIRNLGVLNQFDLLKPDATFGQYFASSTRYTVNLAKPAKLIIFISRGHYADNTYYDGFTLYVYDVDANGYYEMPLGDGQSWKTFAYKSGLPNKIDSISPTQVTFKRSGSVGITIIGLIYYAKDIDVTPNLTARGNIAVNAMLTLNDVTSKYLICGMMPSSLTSPKSRLEVYNNKTQKGMYYEMSGVSSSAQFLNGEVSYSDHISKTATTTVYKNTDVKRYVVVGSFDS